MLIPDWMNKTKIMNKGRMTDAIFNRPEGTSLLTVSNHESCLDDPALIGEELSELTILTCLILK